MNSYGSAKDAIEAAGLRAFDKIGFDDSTVAAICASAGASNGSFFHFFGSKRGLAANLFMQALRSYHAAMLVPLALPSGASAGVAALVSAHLDWVVAQRRAAKFMFEQSRAEWMVDVRAEQQAENAAFGNAITAWIAPLVASGAVRDMPVSVFVSQVIGPAQIFCRAWLSGRDRADPRDHAALLSDCAIRAVIA